MSIDVIIKSNRSNKYELKVRSILANLKGYADTIEGAFRVFNLDLNEQPRMSVGAPKDFYKAEMAADGKSFEVFHLNAQGDKDRVVGYVRTI